MNKITELLNRQGVDGVLITSPWNMQYQCGFSGGEGYLLMTRSSTTLVTDFRYMIWAKKQCPRIPVIDMGKDYYGPLENLVSKEHIKTLAVEGEYMTLSTGELIKDRLKDCSLKYLTTQLDELRMVKTENEIANILRAEQIGDEAFANIVPKLHVGMTEYEVAALLEYEMKSLGAEALSFETIAASGENSAMPHATPTNRQLAKGDFLTMDFGCKYKGYCSDMTRTVCIGKPTQQMKHVYETVLKASELVLNSIRPGMTGKEVDFIARDYIYKHGYEGCFGHGLGHSVGLQIHERPAFSMRENIIIKENMVITVEPGIYLESKFGVRIEDVVQITATGVRNLTSSPKEMIEISV